MTRQPEFVLHDIHRSAGAVRVFQMLEIPYRNEGFSRANHALLHARNEQGRARHQIVQTKATAIEFERDRK